MAAPVSLEQESFIAGLRSEPPPVEHSVVPVQGNKGEKHNSLFPLNLWISQLASLRASSIPLSVMFNPE
jgi:hypothetical protein